MDFDFLPYFRRDFTSWRKSLRAWDWRHSTRITTPVLSLPVSQSIEVKINNCFPSCCLAHSLVEIEEKENSHFLRWNHVLAYELAYLMMNYIFTRKYPLRGYILGVLTDTTAWDLLWGGNGTLKWVSIYIAWLHLAYYCNVRSSASPYLMDPRGLRVTQTTYFSLLTHAK